MKRLIIIGAGGHGRVVHEVARKCGYKQIVFLDDADEVGAIGKVSDFKKYIDDAVFFVSIGTNHVREKITKNLILGNAQIVTLIHPNAVVSDSAKIGKGTVVMAGSVINANALVGDGVIINTCSSVDHDCRIGDFSHIAVGAHICGTVNIGNNTWIGAGATVSNDVNICDSCVIGAGAVVGKNLEKSGTYIGVPAKLK